VVSSPERKGVAVDPIVAVAAVVLLFLVVLRLFRVGCKLLVYAFYFALLVFAASVLYSVLRQSGVFDQAGWK